MLPIARNNVMDPTESRRANIEIGMSKGTMSPPPSEIPTILVVNATTEAAQQITSELSLALPDAEILFAPTIAIAELLIKRRTIDLIISNSLLPDGPESRLESIVQGSTTPPELLVVGGSFTAERLRESTYSCRLWRHLGEQKQRKRSAVAALGSDLRNDLNNPLQEIVALLYVAKSTGTASPLALQALDAIERATKNMTAVVKGLEEKIRTAVGG